MTEFGSANGKALALSAGEWRKSLLWLILLARHRPFRAISVGMFASPGSNSASTDLRRMQTLHSSCCDFGGDNTFTTRWSGGKVQVLSPSLSPCQSSGNHYEGCSRRHLKKINGWPLSGIALAGQTGEHRHRVFLSQWLSLRATTSLFYEKVLSILRYWLSSRVKRFWWFVNLGPLRRHFFVMWKENFQLKWPNHITEQSSACWMAWSFIGLWEKIRHPRIGCLLNSNWMTQPLQISLRIAQKLGNELWHEFQSITPKLEVCSRNIHNWKCCQKTI